MTNKQTRCGLSFFHWSDVLLWPLYFLVALLIVSAKPPYDPEDRG